MLTPPSLADGAQPGDPDVSTSTATQPSCHPKRQMQVIKQPLGGGRDAVGREAKRQDEVGESQPCPGMLNPELLFLPPLSSVFCFHSPFQHPRKTPKLHELNISNSNLLV